MVRRRLAFAWSVCVVLAACSSPNQPATSSRTITVLAASSLKEAFTQLGQQYSQAHPDTKVVFSFGASSALAQQLNEGAPADLFASASSATMQSAGQSVGQPSTFATNVLAIATPPDNPAGIVGLADLAQPKVKIAVCQAAVPCGVAATRLFALAQISVQPVTQEVDVKSVLSKVELGEVDAGIVYFTDVLAAGAKVHGIAIPKAANISTSYPIAVVKASAQRAAAADFLAFVLSANGQRVLASAGFGAP